MSPSKILNSNPTLIFVGKLTQKGNIVEKTAAKRLSTKTVDNSVDEHVKMMRRQLKSGFISKCTFFDQIPIYTYYS